MKARAKSSRRRARVRVRVAENEAMDGRGDTVAAPPPVDATSPEKERSIMSQWAEHESVRFAAPFVGAAGGALAATIAVERLGLRREVATFGGAVLAAVAAQGQSGVMKSLLDGAAMAGLCLGVAELLRVNRPTWIFGDQPEPVPPRQAAPPPDAVTRADLHKALEALHASHAAELDRRDDAHLAQMRDAQTTMHELLDRLRNADAEIARLRAGKIEGDRGRAASEAASVDGGMDIAQAMAEISDGAANEVGAESEDEPSVVVESVPAGETAEGDVDADTVTHMRAVYALLNTDERQQLSTLVATAPEDVLQREQDNLLRLSPAESAAYLRSSVFPTLTA